MTIFMLSKEESYSFNSNFKKKALSSSKQALADISMCRHVPIFFFPIYWT